ncbi:MAG: cytochrome c biogenesis protein CcsA [Leptospira sp.]|nr:cytochrome c biogenesis protein CcsA [Leptospira sp.]
MVPPSLDAALLVLTIVSLVGAVFFSLTYPNVILEQGMSHRIFYFHVPVAWIALYGPILSSIFSILYLWKKKYIFDSLAFTSNQLALVFSIGVLFSGPIWAFSAWGVPWDRTDARLQSFFILCVSLLTYFIFRYLIDNIRKRAIISAYLSLLCAISSILTWGAIRWIENPGNHPGSVLGKGGMDADMRLSFWISVFSFHLLFLVFFVVAYRFQKLQNLRQNLKWE